MINSRVVLGDIVQVAAQAIVTGLNNQGVWSDLHFRLGDKDCHWVPPQAAGVDGAIQRVAGWQFHAQALPLLGQNQGATLLAASQHPHSGAFQQVLFVIDNGWKPLEEIVTAALRAANGAGLSSLALPLLRAGAMGRDAQSCLKSIVLAVTSFRASNLREVVCVTHHPRLAAAWQRAFQGQSFKVWPRKPKSAPVLPSVEVVQASLGEVEADAILATVDSGGGWQRGVDIAIRDLAGDQFHRQAAALIGQSAGTTLVTTAREPHQAPFTTVVFVVDDLHRPLGDLVAAGLRVADAAGLATVAVPALRPGPPEKMLDMVSSVSQVLASASQLRKIIFVFADRAGAEAMHQLCWAHLKGALISRPQVELFEEVVAFSADGSRLLYSPSAGLVEVREVETGRLCGQIRITPWGEGSRLDVAALDPLGQRALLGARFGTLTLYEVASGEALFRLAPEQEPCMPVGNKAAAFSSDGKLALAGFDHRQVGIWEVATGDRLHFMSMPAPPPAQPAAYQQLVTHLELSPDGCTLFACCSDQAHCLWSLPSGSVLHCASPYLDHGDDPWPKDRAADPPGLAVLDEQKSVHWRDRSSGETLTLSLPGESISRLIVDPGGDWLVTTRNHKEFHETVCWRLLPGRLEPLWKRCWELGYKAGFLHDGSLVSVSTRNHITEVRVIDTQGQERLRFWPSGRSPQLRLSQRIVLVTGQLNQAEAWSLTSGKRVQPGGAPTSLPSGYLAEGPCGPFVMLELIHGCRRYYRLQVLSLDKRRLLVETDRGTACLSFDEQWRLDGWLPLEAAVPLAACFRANGDLLVFTGQLCLWRKAVG